VLGVALLTMLWQLVFFDRWFGVMDEGHMLQFADIVARGGELYRDATIYPLPGAFYALALAFRLFEPSILLSRWIVVLEFSTFVAMLFVWVRKIVPLRWAWGAVVMLLMYRLWTFPHWHAYNYSTTATLVLVASMLALLRYFETGRRPMLGFAGFLFGLGVFCKQDYGAAALLGMGFALAVYARSGPTERRERFGTLIVWFLGPAAVVGAAAGIHFLRQGVLADVIQLTMVTHLIGITAYEYPSFPPLLPFFSQDPTLRTHAGLFDYMPAILWTVDLPAIRESSAYKDTALYDMAIKAFFYGPYALVALGGVRLWRLRSALWDGGSRLVYLRELTLFASAAALMLLISLNKPQDYLHLAVLYWPFPCLAIVWAHALVRRRRTLAWLLAALLILPTAGAIGYTGRLAWGLRTLHSDLIPLERAGIYAKPSEALLLRDLVAYVRRNTTPNQPVAVMPFSPIVNFLADRRGPHASSYVLWPFPEYPDRDRRIIDAMEASRTSLVIYHFVKFPTFPTVEAYAPELFSYLVENFRTDQVFTNDTFGLMLVALKRAREPTDGSPIVPADGEGVALWTDGPGAGRQPVLAEERSRFLARDLWPFQPVIALRPTADGKRTVLSVPVTVPRGARLRTAIGIHPTQWFMLPKSWTRFTVTVESNGKRAELFSRMLDPMVNLGDRGWFDVDLSLDEYAGRHVKLEFSTASEARQGETLVMGGWGEPRMLVLPPDDAALDVTSTIR
jgi:hypothetical protein